MYFGGRDAAAQEQGRKGVAGGSLGVTATKENASTAQVFG